MKIDRRLTQFAVVLFLILTCAAFAAQKPVSIPEEIEWTWEVRPPHPDPKLPNVLLLGELCLSQLFPPGDKGPGRHGQCLPDGVLYLCRLSTPAAPDPEFAAMENVPFRVVHFNNGMHSGGLYGGTVQGGLSGVPAHRALTRPRQRRADLGHHHSGRTQGLQRRHQRSRGRTECHRARLHRCRAYSCRRPARPDDEASGSHQDTVHFNTAGSNLMETRPQPPSARNCAIGLATSGWHVFRLHPSKWRLSASNHPETPRIH